jgi:hypothetical protein
VSGADPVGARPGFAEMLEALLANGARTIIVESPDRFARDLMVQLAGHDMLKAKGLTLIAASAPMHFTEDTPTAILVRQVLGAVAEFEKTTTVAKLAAARRRKRLATGKCESGWGLLVLDGKPMFAYAFSNQDGFLYPLQNKYKTRIVAAEPITPGKHTIVFDFAYDGGGIGKGGGGSLIVDGQKVGAGRIEFTQPIRFSLDESFDVGEDTGTPVIDEYDAKMPFRFSGALNKVEIDLGVDGLTPEKHGELERLQRDYAMRVQ